VLSRTLRAFFGKFQINLSVTGSKFQKLNQNLHWDHSVHYHRYRHSSIHFHYSAQFGAAIVRCNYFRQRSVVATFAVDVAVVAVGAADFESVADVC
jgi:hypothetical protein